MASHDAFPLARVHAAAGYPPTPLFVRSPRENIVIDSPRSETEASAPEAEKAPRYHADTEWFNENNLSFEDVVRARVCDACRGQFGTEKEERVPVFDPETGRPRIESRKTVVGTDPIKVIRDHCGSAKNYITRDMPTLEAVFRVILAGGNQPVTLQQVREELMEWCPGGGCQWLLLPVELLDRLVRNDRQYGLRRADEA
jgi:hypothetical protein